MFDLRVVKSLVGRQEPTVGQVVFGWLLVGCGLG